MTLPIALMFLVIGLAAVLAVLAVLAGVAFVLIDRAERGK